jgi:hypothetical protein
MKTRALFIAVLCSSCSPTLGPVVPKTPVQRQMLGLLQKFDRWDDDGDGYLDAGEISTGIESLKGKPQQVTYTAAEVIDFYDTNHDRKISLMEAQAGYQRSAEAEAHLQH